MELKLPTVQMGTTTGVLELLVMPSGRGKQGQYTFTNRDHNIGALTQPTFGHMQLANCFKLHLSKLLNQRTATLQEYSHRHSLTSFHDERKLIMSYSLPRRRQLGSCLAHFSGRRLAIAQIPVHIRLWTPTLQVLCAGRQRIHNFATSIIHSTR